MVILDESQVDDYMKQIQQIAEDQQQLEQAWRDLVAQIQLDPLNINHIMEYIGTLSDITNRTVVTQNDILRDLIYNIRYLEEQ